MTTATVITVMHDAHVACRTSFVAARTAMVRKATARRVAAATRSATYVANRTATKAANAAKVAAKEAAEKHASVVSKWEARVQARAMAKAANAPAANAAKKAVAVVAKLLKAANAVRLAAMRATRAAAKATAVVKATMVAIDNGVAAIDNGVMVAPATTVVAPAPVNVHEVVAFLAMTPCLCALWFYATFDIAARAADKEAAKAANRAHARIRAPRVPMNTPEKRASITLACAIARKANIHAVASHGNTLSPATVAARAAQGDAQRAANAIRALARMVTPKKACTAKVYAPICSSKAATVPSIAQHDSLHKSTHVVHATHTKAADARGEFKTLASAKKAAKAALVIEQAAKWAMRKEAAKNRKEAMEKIASDAWMMKGVWLSEDLLMAANDWSYAVRVNAFKEARNIAYGTVALVGVAA